MHDKKCQKYFQSLSPILYVKQHLNYQKSKVKMRTNMFKRHRIGTIVQIPVNFCLRRSITTDTTPPTHQHLAEVSKQFLRSFHGFCVSPSFLIRQNFRSPISISIVQITKRQVVLLLYNCNTNVKNITLPYLPGL